MGAAPAVVGAGVALQAYGQYKGLQAAAVQSEYNAQIARTNAEITKKRKKELVGIGAKQAVRLEADVVHFIGEQVTAYASGGIDISSSVVSEAVEQTARTASADILTLQHNIAKDIWGLEVGIMTDEMQALFDKAKARRARRLAPIAAGGTALFGIGSI